MGNYGSVLRFKSRQPYLVSCIIFLTLLFTYTTELYKIQLNDLFPNHFKKKADLPVIELEFRIKTVLSGYKKTPKLKIAYQDLSQCGDPKPLYLKQYKAHCWTTCAPQYECNTSDMFTEVQQKRAYLHCFPNLHLIGMRKSATTDFSKWFYGHPHTTSTQQGYWPEARLSCPLEYFRHRKQRLPAEGGGYFNNGPGNMAINMRLGANTTHLKVLTATQLLGFMATPDTKFYVQLRNPTDRAISYMFHWHKFHLLYNGIPFENMTGETIDHLVKDNMKKLKDCINKLGELGCYYSTDSHEGSQNSLLLHSIYIIMVEETLKFIPRRQIMFVTTSEYSQNQVTMVRSVMEEFMNITFQENMVKTAISMKLNTGHKNPVLRSTLEYLDKFFEPYNRRLANLLGDDKWLFKVNRTLQNVEL